MQMSFPWLLKLLVAASAAATAPPGPSPALGPPPFRHPGVLNTQQSLAAVAAELRTGNPARRAAFQPVLDFIRQHPAPATFPAVVYAVAGAGSPTEDQIRRDAELAYAYALQWAATGEPAAAAQARRILGGYATTFERYGTAPKPDGSPTEFRQTYLEAAWVAPTFVAAAEILRYYRVGGCTSAGWPAAEVARFSGFLQNLRDHYVNPLPAATPWVNNWQASCGYAQLALAVWFDDQPAYRAALRYLGGQVLPQVFYPSGSVKELCDRDCHHPQYTLTALTDAAEIARIQGSDSLYQARGQLLKTGWQQLDEAQRHIPGSCADCSQHLAVWPGIEVAAAYYQAPALRPVRDRGAPYGVPTDHTFAGFSTFTHRALGQ